MTGHGWLKLIGSSSWIVYELDHRKPEPVLYVIPIEHILGILPVAPVGDTGLTWTQLCECSAAASLCAYKYMLV